MTHLFKGKLGQNTGEELYFDNLRAFNLREVLKFNIRQRLCNTLAILLVYFKAIKE